MVSGNISKLRIAIIKKLKDYCCCEQTAFKILVWIWSDLTFSYSLLYSLTKSCLGEPLLLLESLLAFVAQLFQSLHKMAP